MSYAIINGSQVSVRYIKSGFILKIAEQNKDIVHDVAVWGHVAQSLKPQLRKDRHFEIRCAIENKQYNKRRYINFTAQTWKCLPQNKPTPASYAIIDGYQCSPSFNNYGFTLVIKDPTLNKLQTIHQYHRVGVWGEMAKMLEPRLNRGTHWAFKCDITHKSNGETKYINFNGLSWKCIPKPLKKPYEPKPERDDDWFVPSTENRFDRDRRYDGFPAA